MCWFDKLKLPVEPILIKAEHINPTFYRFSCDRPEYNFDSSLKVLYHLGLLCFVVPHVGLVRAVCVLSSGEVRVREERTMFVFSVEIKTHCMLSLSLSLSLSLISNIVRMKLLLISVITL